MAIINQRWPRDILPATCVFGRTRNDERQESPRTRKATIIRKGRPLWSARLGWKLANTERLAKLRYWMESLDGFNGSAQIWNFASARPDGLILATADPEAERIFWTYNGNRSPWSFAGLPSHWIYDSTVTVAAAAAIGATSISLTGLQASALAVVQGQYVQIGRRLYLAAATAMADGAGAVTITLVSPLVAAATIGDVARIAEAGCEMQLAEQNFDESGAAGDGFIQVSATFIESVEDVT